MTIVEYAYLRSANTSIAAVVRGIPCARRRSYVAGWHMQRGGQMSGQKRVRLGLALVLGTMLASLIAAPASAATTTTRYVDDNPKSTACNHTSFHSIQAAIDASDAADKVLVCPGTY